MTGMPGPSVARAACGYAQPRFSTLFTFQDFRFLPT
jgi:hypothetical protein